MLHNLDREKIQKWATMICLGFIVAYVIFAQIIQPPKVESEHKNASKATPKSEKKKSSAPPHTPFQANPSDPLDSYIQVDEVSPQLKHNNNAPEDFQASKTLLGDYPLLPSILEGIAEDEKERILEALKNRPYSFSFSDLDNILTLSPLARERLQEWFSLKP